ncbi:hypothetical protein CVD28_11870 [Bacillus sp. M6-12]|uniref:hypothetical protein n=1 Tax=Bacillus sp. M6-12 TaxID=2054166 RepID=UPI000C77F335|nr:hypothetical protein [Bacillus sp. M6-12]PLS17261.1 hypothetical protein CVD28_11870 [Bacillus sp. M6-12]
MKKYHYTLFILIAIVVSIGGFYINGAVSASQLPEYKVVRLEGDKKEADPVMLKGQLGMGRHVANPEDVRITSHGTEYGSSKSFIALFSEIVENNYGIEKLQKKYPGFMRGKAGASSFYEDKDFLAYAAIKENGAARRGLNDFKINIALLEKQTDKQNSFSIKVSAKESYSYLTVIDVQLVGRTLKIVTEQSLYKQTDHDNREAHVYTIDLSKKEIISDDVIFVYDKKADDIRYYVQLVREVSPTSPNKYVLYYINAVKEKTDSNGEMSSNQLSSELNLYNLETNETDTITTVSDLSGTGNASYYDDNTVYTLHRKDDGLQIEQNDLNSKKTVKSYLIPMEIPKQQEDLNHIIKNDRIYIFTAESIHTENSSTQMPGVLIVADLKTGKVLYKGKVKPFKTGKESNDNLWINYMEVKEK